MCMDINGVGVVESSTGEGVVCGVSFPRLEAGLDVADGVLVATPPDDVVVTTGLFIPGVDPVLLNISVVKGPANEGVVAIFGVLFPRVKAGFAAADDILVAAVTPPDDKVVTTAGVIFSGAYPALVYIGDVGVDVIAIVVAVLTFDVPAAGVVTAATCAVVGNRIFGNLVVYTLLLPPHLVS